MSSTENPSPGPAADSHLDAAFGSVLYDDTEMPGLKIRSRRIRVESGLPTVELHAHYWPHSFESSVEYLGSVTVTQKEPGLREYTWAGMVLDRDASVAPPVARAQEILYQLSREVRV